MRTPTGAPTGGEGGCTRPRGRLAHARQADDELDNPYLAGFEWDKEESWTRLVVHLQKQPTVGGGGGGKKKKNKKEEE